MTQYSKEAFEVKFNDGTTGLFRTGQTRGIGSDDMRTFVEDTLDSVNWNGDLVSIAEITLSAADIKASNSSPVTIVAAPGGNYIVVPIAFFLYYSWNSAAYTTNTTFRFEINGVAVSNTNTTMLTGTADRYTTMYPIEFDTTTAMFNQALYFEAQSGDPATGDSPIYLTCLYKTAQKIIPA